jgi:hypothetical protein
MDIYNIYESHIYSFIFVKRDVSVIINLLNVNSSIACPVYSPFFFPIFRNIVFTQKKKIRNLVIGPSNSTSKSGFEFSINFTNKYSKLNLALHTCCDKIKCISFA